ncbi:halocarboxylic acid dehydrogenase DehI family protein [Alienimonas californiensis]|uniref:2-haloacid dehalogenase, configuration-inverting n=1 Tax=Alienimonas californiensis TaxID=2527989 RepID=A0A517PBD0_9PLAN|nr:halocarboxylic acid dehydrogenase DehI family protein [Alienimonas californiensis]QDT16661.1 2-haloacid dehalogenase, configuration-inverting [Alienimonas californiensis]
MFGIGRPQPVDEYEARGEVERVYHEIRQSLRVRGVNLLFRTWAGYEGFLPVAWDALRPNLETRAFEDAADAVRTAAVRAATPLGPLGARGACGLGESQGWQLSRSLALYHYVNPKLLVLVSAARLALAGERVGGAAAGDPPERIERGEPAAMLPMEMVDEEPDDERLQELFADLKATLDLPSVNSDYRTLALWPDYLAAAWERLKPIVARPEYAAAADELRATSRRLAADLPLPVPLSAEGVREAGADPDALLEKTETFERLLPGLILNVALFSQDWRSPEELRVSPYPAAPRPPQSRSPR